MRVKKVNRYYCDFCKKSGCSGGALKKHELHCTMNPNRICRMCALAKEEQTPMTTLLATLPIMIFDVTAPAPPDINIDALRESAHNCPVCIFSALRQKGIPIYYTGFDYQVEATEFIREAHNTDEYMY